MSNRNKLREKLIHFKVKHVFIARDQTSKTEVYPISMFTSGLLVKLIVFTYERLTFQHQLLQEILRNCGELFHLPPSLHSGNNTGRMAGQGQGCGSWANDSNIFTPVFLTSNRQRRASNILPLTTTNLDHLPLTQADTLPNE